MDAGSPEKPVRPVKPLGIIPAGSTDVVSCSVHGVRDPVTAALHIVLGHLQQVDMCSFSSLGQLIRFGFSAMFGFGGRSLARAEKKRWMSSSRRREYALVKTLARLRCHRHRPGGSDRCGFKGMGSFKGEESWTTNQGLYLSIKALTAVRNTSRTEFIKHLKRYSGSSGQFSFSFVETHTVSSVRIRPRSVIGWSGEETAFPWNIDGELVEIANEVLIRYGNRKRMKKLI
uniref:DAGKc domain-containing protein n=1 Tax=Sphaeramia orbicularis TaxID=375764 RepID=A0A672Z4A2_9TELE